MRSVAVGIFLAFLVVPAIAEDGQPATTPASESPEIQADLNKVVCKKLGPTTGSRLGGQKICQTKKHWLELEKNSRDVLEKVQSSASQFGGGQ